jgi:hypothetical protein
MGGMLPKRNFGKIIRAGTLRKIQIAEKNN